MKKLFTIALILFSSVVFSQQLPSRNIDNLPSRRPEMLHSRMYQQPKVKIKGNKVTITMSKQQYLEMERRKQMMMAHKPHRPGFRPQMPKK